MRIVIEIPEEEYKRIKACTSFMPWAEHLIKNGTPLNDVLDKIKAEIREFSVVDESGTYRIMTYIVNQIIDKYKGKSDCHSCKTEYDCYECEKYEKSEEMTKVTTDFAIDYLLDDCQDCPENKGGECMTQSHCFEVKRMAIDALKQEPKTGQWILSGGYWRCSKCKEKALLKLDKSKGGCREYIPIRSNICPNCGAEMKEGE